MSKKNLTSVSGKAFQNSARPSRLLQFLVDGSGGMNSDEIKEVFSSIGQVKKNNPATKVQHGFFGDMDGFRNTTEVDLQDPRVLKALSLNLQGPTYLAPSLFDMINAHGGERQIIIVSDGFLTDHQEAELLLVRALKDHQKTTLGVVVIGDRPSVQSNLCDTLKKLENSFPDQISRPVVIDNISHYAAISQVIHACQEKRDAQPKVKHSRHPGK